ncbi:hypothetical protein BKA57DRAFT_491227 [Linnemannia elongata]|nr:hypothetical protein BKA57DRAFT_491227 [Linnemannia elongata]
MPSVPVIFFIATTATLATFVSAQLAVPVCCMSYTHIDETTLYIQGGLDNNRTAVNQFIALDLTIPSWDASAPPWKIPLNLNGTNPPTSSWHSMVVAKDRGKLFIWDALQTTAVWWTYNIAENSWRNYAVPTGTAEMATTNSSILVNFTRQAGIRNGVNLATGEVYVSSGAGDGTQMTLHTIDPTTGLPATSRPSNIRQNPIAHESFVWSIYRNSFLHYGGRSMNGTKSNPQLNELLTMNNWVTLETNGTSPGDVSGHCMVPAYGGRNMIVFGGASLDGIAKADIYILDLPTSTWTTGKPADASQARTNMACAVAGDNFIAWGVFLFYRRRIPSRNGTHNNSNGNANGFSLRDPQNPEGDPMAELLGVLLTSSSASPSNPLRMHYNREDFFKRLAASPLAGPHTILRDPQGEQQHRSTSADEDEAVRVNSGCHDQHPSPLNPPRSPHMVHHSTADLSDWPSDDIDNDNSGEHEGAKRAQQPPLPPPSPSPSPSPSSPSSPSPPLPSSPRNPQTETTDGLNGPPRAPQWQKSLPPVVFLDHSQYLERSQELTWMMEAIKAEKEVLDRRKLVQDVLVAQMRANYPVPPLPSSNPQK